MLLLNYFVSNKSAKTKKILNINKNPSFSLKLFRNLLKTFEIKQ